VRDRYDSRDGGGLVQRYDLFAFGGVAAAAESAGLGGGAVGAGFAEAVGVIAFSPGVQPS
jgi:hypothetical protein